MAILFLVSFVSCKEQKITRGVMTANPRTSLDSEARMDRQIPSQDVSSVPALKKFAALAASDLNGALSQIEKELKPNERDEFLKDLAFELSDSDPKFISKIIEHINSAELRKQAWAGFGYTAAQKTPVALFDYAANELTGSDKNTVMYQSIKGMLGSSHAVQTKKMIDTMPLSSARLDAIALVASSIAAENIPAAIEWAKSFNVPEDRDKALGALVSAVTKYQGLAGLDALLNETQNKGVRSQAVQEGVAIAARQGGIPLAAEWIAKLPPGSQGSAASLLIQSSAVEDSASWDKLFASIKNEGEQQQAVSAVAYKLSQKSPLSAAQWALTVPGNLRHAALGSLVISWYDIDSSQMSDWMSALPKGADRDFVLSRVAIHIAQSDKETASQLANQIADPTLKKTTQVYFK